MPLLSANGRHHWAHRHRITRQLRDTTRWLARARHIPHLQRAHIVAVYQPPDRRRRDPANLYPAVKACVDGLVDAHVIPDDDAAHLDGPDMRLAHITRGGRLTLHITELSASTGLPR
ncbi:MAG: hypothetical protein ACRDMV_25205 [Streptosporangiales bacterium]